MTLKQLTLGLVLAGTFAIPSIAQDADTVRSEIEDVFGTVPSFLSVYPDSTMSAGWEAVKRLNLNENTAIDAKTLELIALAVSAQIPCDYCVYYHERSAVSKGATQQELREAIYMAAITRHWSTLLHGNRYDMEDFEAEADSFFPAQ